MQGRVRSPRGDDAIRPKSGRGEGRKVKSAAWEGMFASPSAQRQSGVESVHGGTWRNGSRKDIYDTDSDEEIPRSSSGLKSLHNSSAQFPHGMQEQVNRTEDYRKQSRSPSPHRSYSRFDQTYNEFLKSNRLAQTISTNPDKHSAMSTKLVEKIKSSQYIDFSEFLPHNVLESTAWNDKHVSKTLDGASKVTEFSEWVQCMMVYISVLSREYPERIGDLLGYVVNISMLYQESDEKGAWVRYDEAFRRKASLRRLVSWSKWDKELWVLASSSEARHNVSCKSCLSYEHDDKSCPFSQQVKEFNEIRQRRQGYSQEMARYTCWVSLKDTCI